MASITLPEWMKQETDPLKSGVIETLYTEEPIMQLIPWMTIAGLAYPYNREESLPGVNFRKINEPYTPTTGIVNRLVEVLRPFGSESDCDRALVSAYGNGQRVQRLESHLKAQAVKFVQMFLYGNSPGSRAGTAYDDIDGFDGMQARCGASQIIDAGGSSGTDGSSVFAIKFGENAVCGLQTADGIDVEDLGILQTKPAYRTRVEQIAGIGVFNGTAVGWVKDLTVTTNVLTCDDMDELRDKIGGDPTCFIMSKRSRRQLKINARSLGIVLGSSFDVLGRRMQTWGEIPIYVSDAIIDTETVS